jgi:LETM1 and EF-hand domain-containing protein 1
MRIMKYVKNPKELLLFIWGGIMHTFHGFRLFALETRLSMKYVLKLLRGQSLNRKERQQVFASKLIPIYNIQFQLVRTSADLFRLVPFSIFVIVPFMELLFPLYIKLFPQMMPSTFQDVSKEAINEFMIKFNLHNKFTCRSRNI